MKESLIKYLNKEVVVKTCELELVTKSRVAIIRLIHKGLLQSVARGYYSLPKYDIFNALLLIVSKYYKEAVISGLAGARYYNLTDENIDKIDVDIPKTMNIKNSFLKVKRTEKNKIIGINTLKIYGHKVKIYGPERILVDIKIKYAPSIFYKVLKRYLSNYEPNFNKIKKYDEFFSTNVIEAVMQELSDG